MRLSRLPVICLLFLLSACKVGPKYKKPQPELPKKYLKHGQTEAVAQLKEWWTFFNDPVLNDLIAKALEQNYDLRIAKEKIEETRALYRIEEAKLFPEIDAIGQVNSIRLSKNLKQSSFVSKNEFAYFQLGFDVLWQLDVWGKQQRIEAAAIDLFQAQIEMMRDVYLTLLSDVARAYIDYCTLQKKINLLKQQIRVDTSLLSLTTDRFTSGLASKIPDLDQHAVLEESKNQLLLLQTALEQTLYRLSLLLGQNPESFIFSGYQKSVPLSSKILAVGMPSDLLRRRPDIRMAERQLAAATENVGAAIADYFPSFSLLAEQGNTLTFQSNSLSKLFDGNSFSWTIGPSFTWPLITFGRISYNIKAKKSVQKQALLAYGKSIVNALSEVESWMVAYFNQKKQVAVIQEKLDAIIQEQRLIQSLFDSGLANKTEALLAEKNRITIESELTDNQQAASSSLISLYKALGGEW